MAAIALAASSSPGAKSEGALDESQRLPRGTAPRTIGATRIDRVPASSASRSARQGRVEDLPGVVDPRVPVPRAEEVRDLAPLVPPLRPTGIPGVAIPHERSAGPSTGLTTPAASNGRTRRAAAATRAKTSGNDNVSATIRAISVRTPTSGSAARGAGGLSGTKGAFYGRLP